MTSHRKIFLTPALVAVLMTVTAPSALADSLLSGYGGPGEGNQAILGSALLGAGRGGGSSSGGSSSGDSGSAGSSSAGEAARGGQAGPGNAAPIGASGRGGRTAGGGGRAAGGAAGSRGGKGEASGGAARAYPVVSRDITQPAAGTTETLGLSGGDLVYVFVALGVLALIGLLTRRLVRASSSRMEGANGSRKAMQDPSNRVRG
jgi:hypothetical protein